MEFSGDLGYFSHQIYPLKMTSEPISDAIFPDQELNVDFENLFGLWLGGRWTRREGGKQSPL